MSMNKRFKYSMIMTLVILPHMFAFKSFLLAIAAGLCGLYTLYCDYKLEEKEVDNDK